MAAHSSILAWRIPTDRGAWWLLSTGVTESDTTKHSIAAVSRVGGQDNPLGTERRRWYSFCILYLTFRIFILCFKMCKVY